MVKVADWKKDRSGNKTKPVQKIPDVPIISDEELAAVTPPVNTKIKPMTVQGQIALIDGKPGLIQRTKQELMSPIRKPSNVQVTNRGFIIAIMTRMEKDKRFIIKIIRVKVIEQIFHWRNGSYEIDGTKAFLFGKAPMIMYDVDVCEPLDLTRAEGQRPIHHPIEFDENCHYSENVDMILKNQIIKQGLGAVSPQSGLGMMTVIIGVMCTGMGLAIGVLLAPLFPHAAAEAVTITTSATTSSSHTTSTLLGNIIWSIMQRL